MIWWIALAAKAAPLPVVGGDVLEVSVWPDVVAVSAAERPNEGVICTGVLVAPDVVLTAAHCIGPVQSVALDTLDYTEPQVEVRVTAQYAHPDQYTTYDVGVLVLERPTTVPVRVLARGCVQERYVQADAPASIVGFGANDEYGRDYDSLLRQADTTITDLACERLGCNEAVSPGGELGAGGEGIDACYGDSGGPLYLRTEVGDYLVGLSSRSWLGAYPPCRHGGIYVRPDAVLDWIEQVSGRTLPTPTCNLPPSPSAETLTVEAGQTAWLGLEAGDPEDDVVGWQIVEHPTTGRARIEGDRLYFRAFDHSEGTHTVTLRVTDEGVPRHTADLAVTIEVVPPAGGCNHGSGGPNGAVWSLVLLGLARRARRRALTRPRSDTPKA